MMLRNTPGRLSARWEVFHHSTDKSPVTAWTYLLIFSLSVVLMTGCQDKSTAQSKTSKPAQEKQLNEAHDETPNKPKVDIKVNRHFDEKGKMIGFDSTYSSYYSSVDGDTAKMDNMFKDFNSYFKKQHQSMFDDDFNDVFFNDSLMYPDFFHKDFFSQRYSLNDKYFRSMMSEMDSVKNKFYRDNRSKKKP